MKLTLKRKFVANKLAETHQAIATSIAGSRPAVRGVHR